MDTPRESGNVEAPASPRPRPSPKPRPADPGKREGAHRAGRPADDSKKLPELVGDDYDAFMDELFLQQRATPRRLSKLPKLVLDAARIVWQTSRLQTTAIVSVQVLVAGLGALTVLLGGLAIRGLLNVQDGQSLTHLIVPLLLITLVSTAGTLSSTGSSQFGRLLGARVQREVSGRVLDVTADVDLITYDDARFHDQLNRVLANVPIQPFSVVTSLASLIGGVAGVVALTVTLTVIQPILVPILLLGGIPLWYLSRKGGRLEFEFAVSQTTSLREREYLESTLARREDAAELRAYGTAAPLRRRWNALYDSFLEALRIQVRRRYLLSAFTGLASGAVLVLTLSVLVLLIHRGSIGFAAAGSAAVAIRLLSSRLQLLISGLSALFQAALFLEDYAEFLQRSPDSAGQENRPKPAVEPLQSLDLNNVTFRYPNTTVPAVRNVSLSLLPGEVIALVGENGSGKTTLAKLLAGLYQPASGNLVLNGRGISEDDRLRVQQSVALVLQDFTHYALSAAENISFGRPEVEPDKGRIVGSAKSVGAHTFITQLPEGYDTRLSRIFKDGRELSVGQWQRVALARAFYRDAPIVILDEPTAALDPRAEAQLYDSVRSVLAGRTVVLITHRLASVRGADRIVVLDHGRVAEEGNHTDLMSRGGLYAELVGLQQNRHIGSLPRADVSNSRGELD